MIQLWWLTTVMQGVRACAPALAPCASRHLACYRAGARALAPMPTAAGVQVAGPERAHLQLDTGYPVADAPPPHPVPVPAPTAAGVRVVGAEALAPASCACYRQPTAVRVAEVVRLQRLSCDGRGARSRTLRLPPSGLLPCRCPRPRSRLWRLACVWPGRSPPPLVWGRAECGCRDPAPCACYRAGGRALAPLPTAAGVRA